MWLDNFNEMRKASGLSLDELSEKSGVPKGTLAKITSGITKAPALETMRSLVYAMGYTLNELEDTAQSKSIFSKAEEEMLKKYRLLDDYGKEAVAGLLDCEYRRCTSIPEETVESGKVIDIFPARHYIQSASAGYGDFNDDSSYETIDLIKRPPAGMSFLITVDGDSMEPTYHNGDLLFVRAQETIQVGEIGLFAIAGNLYIKEAGENGLISHNAAYGIIYPSDDSPVKVEGKIIGICSNEYLQ